jgi:CO/xanthine dehydrogenase FAD-binding subunit
MRSFLPSYSLRTAPSLDGVLAILAEQPGAWRPFAGGTDLMVQLAAGTLTYRQFVSVWGLRELRHVTVADDAVTIGALTTFTDVQRHELLGAEFPLLGRAAADTGGIANQNRGTIGGNIANASPAADTPPALLVYDAEIEVASTRGRRLVPYERFHSGYKQMDLAPDELIVAVRLPRRPGWIHHYRKVGARRAQAISKVCFAAVVRAGQGRISDVRLAFGSVAPTVVRAANAEAALTGAAPDREAIAAAVGALRRDIAPIDDIRSTAAYRTTVAANLLRDFLNSLTTG